MNGASLSSAAENELKYLRLLTPGTMFVNIATPEWGCYTVIQSSVQVYPGPWVQYYVTALESRRQYITHIELESEAFFRRWRVVQRP